MLYPFGVSCYHAYLLHLKTYNHKNVFTVVLRIRTANERVNFNLFTCGCGVTMQKPTTPLDSVYSELKDALTSCHQNGIRWMESLGRHTGHRSFKGQLIASIQTHLPLESFLFSINPICAGPNFNVSLRIK